MMGLSGGLAEQEGKCRYRWLYAKNSGGRRKSIEVASNQAVSQSRACPEPGKEFRMATIRAADLHLIGVCGILLPVAPATSHVVILST